MSSAKKWAAVLALLFSTAGARAGGFSWGDDGTSVTPGITPSIFLRNDNVAAVDQFLSGQTIKAVKIDTDVTPANLAAIYNKYNVNYTFADYETADSATKVAALVNQIKGSTGTGAAFLANQSYVSNFAFAPVYTDPTAAGSGQGTAEYFSSGVNMASENLYPGSPGTRNPVSGNSTAPNIRSALFTLPIERMSLTTASLPAGHAHVPYVDRFNNNGNAALDTDGDPTNGYRFVTQDQLLSRGDFEAQILHYRLRGATAVHGLQGGVEGYTPEQFKSDITQGWNGVAAVNDVMSDPKAHIATLDTKVKADGVLQSLEDVGVVFSGAYSMAKGKLVLLLSNLDEQAHTISFPTTLGGKVVSGDYPLNAGTHEILQFTASGSKWDFAASDAVFADDNRGGVGVPEPSFIALAGAVLLVAGVARRRHS